MALPALVSAYRTTFDSWSIDERTHEHTDESTRTNRVPLRRVIEWLGRVHGLKPGKVKKSTKNNVTLQSGCGSLVLAQELKHLSDASGKWLEWSSFYAHMTKASDSLLARAVNQALAIKDFELFSEHVEALMEEVRRDVPCTGPGAGKNASYIPELAEFDEELFSVVIVSVDGQVLCLGDALEPFPIESCSKPFTYALTLEDRGVKKVHQHVGVEPSGVSFNAFVLNSDGLPHNACINAGAMIVASLFRPDLHVAKRFSELTSSYQRMSGGLNIGFSQAVYLSEKRTADRNFALSWYMRSKGAYPDDVKDVLETVDFYFQTCSVEVNTLALASMAASLANNGVNPLSGERVMSPSNVRRTLQVMLSAGMYDYSGRWAVETGLPAKSGVAGSIYMVVPNKYAVCVYSPPLDSVGNSVRAIEFCKRFTERWQCSLLDIIFSSGQKVGVAEKRITHVDD